MLSPSRGLDFACSENVPANRCHLVRVSCVGEHHTVFGAFLRHTLSGFVHGRVRHAIHLTIINHCNSTCLTEAYGGL
jgi:hypothetical protein